MKTLGLEADDMCYKIAELAKEELDRRNKNSVEYHQPTTQDRR